MGSEIRVGFLHFGKKRKWRILPIGRGKYPPVELLSPPSSDQVLTPETLVAARIEKNFPSGRLHAKILDFLGEKKNPKVDSLVVIYQKDLPRNFSPSVQKDVEKIPQEISKKEIKKRKDLRHLPFVTIDGEDAMDHDDAVALDEKNHLWVAIADVSHFVFPDTPLDREAAHRANSFYFPDRVLPMLPQKLSNNLCSLQPQEDRLSLAIQLSITKTGQIKFVDLCEAIICSRAKLTYEKVDHSFQTQKPHSSVKKHFSMLQAMKHQSQLLRNHRKNQGGVFFDVPEAKVLLDPQGNVLGVGRRKQTPAQQLIEEFMLAANQQVAHYLLDHHLTPIFRIHEKPDPSKLQDFLDWMENNGFESSIDPFQANPFQLKKLLDQTQKDPRSTIFSYLLLRAMAQAQYSTQNIGHYGLGFSDYLHFTSPIRRYADLVVHRMVKNCLHPENPFPTIFPKTFGSLQNLCLYISEQERKAISAERDVIRLKGIRFLQNKVGKTFEAKIISVMPFGFFVELDEHSIEGLVHIHKLPDDRYEFLEKEKILRGRRSSNKFTVGMPILVRVDRASFEEIQLDFSFLRHLPFSKPKGFGS